MPPNGIAAAAIVGWLIETAPDSMAAAKRAAVSTFSLYTDEPKPKSVPFAKAIASASSWNGMIVKTGPKISSLKIGL